MSLLIQSETRFLRDFQKSNDFTKSPLRYPGGKFYAVKHILPFLDCQPHDEYREPFVGGGSIFFAKKKVQFNWLNDLEKDVVDVFTGFCDDQIVKYLETQLAIEIATPERHKEVKNYIPLNFTEKVFRTYFLNRTSYSGIINKPAWGYKEGKSSPPQNWTAFVKQAALKLKNVKMTALDFQDVVFAKPKGKSVLMYLDPPYFHADQKRAYTKSFILEDHIRLSNVLRSTEHNFCLSYDDCKEIRDLYCWAYIYEKKWLYNTANKKGETRDLGNELIITNYQVKTPQLLF
jgi:DNA adenine methylase